MMVYPNREIANENWTDSTGIGILLALGEGDGMYVYNTSPTNYLHLGMPQEVVDCEISVRAIEVDSPRELPIIQLEFYLDDNLVDVVYLDVTDSWRTYTLSVDRWDSVVLMASGDDPAGVDFLRAYPFEGSPTKRTLTGLGI